MNLELEQKLRAEFPILFGPNEYADYLRGFGFECEDGWYELIREFALRAEKHNRANPDEPIIAIIVKEKFGGLEIQGLENMNKGLCHVLGQVEMKSFTVCEMCGEPGKVRRNGWIKTLCNECDEIRERFHNVVKGG